MKFTPRMPTSNRRWKCRTPTLHWRVVGDENKKEHFYDVTGGGRRLNRGIEVSARQLAVRMWQPWLVGGVGGLNSICGSYDGLEFKHDSSLPYPKCIMEGATKWDPRCSRISNQGYCFYCHLKLHEDQVTSTVSVSSTIQAELVRAQLRIHKLESDNQSSKKKTEQLLRRYGEETTSWQRREYQKIQGVVNDLKKELNKKKKNCQRMAILNSKLVNDLASVKSSAKQFRRGYEKERKARELVETVCNELANKIAEGKTEVEVMKMESIKIQQEVEEERKMMQMAEMWREELVQVKLIDAKLVLEDKYCQMNKLINELEGFLSSGSAATLDAMELRKAELIRQAAKSVNVKDIKEFFYVPPKSGDIDSSFEEFRLIEANEWAIEPCDIQSPTSDISKIQTHNSDQLNHYNKKNLLKHSNVCIDDKCRLKESGKAWEILTHDEDQGSNCSPEGSDISVNRQFRQGKKCLGECKTI